MHLGNRNRHILVDTRKVAYLESKDVRYPVNIRLAAENRAGKVLITKKLGQREQFMVLSAPSNLHKSCTETEPN